VKTGGLGVRMQWLERMSDDLQLADASCSIGQPAVMIELLDQFLVFGIVWRELFCLRLEAFVDELMDGGAQLRHLVRMDGCHESMTRLLRASPFITLFPAGYCPALSSFPSKSQPRMPQPPIFCIGHLDGAEALRRSRKCHVHALGAGGEFRHVVAVGPGRDALGF